MDLPMSRITLTFSFYPVPTASSLTHSCLFKSLGPSFSGALCHSLNSVFVSCEISFSHVRICEIFFPPPSCELRENRDHNLTRTVTISFWLPLKFLSDYPMCLRQDFMTALCTGSFLPPWAPIALAPVGSTADIVVYHCCWPSHSTQHGGHCCWTWRMSTQNTPSHAVAHPLSCGLILVNPTSTVASTEEAVCVDSVDVLFFYGSMRARWKRLIVFLWTMFPLSSCSVSCVTRRTRWWAI